MRISSCCGFFLCWIWRSFLSFSHRSFDISSSSRRSFKSLFFRSCLWPRSFSSTLYQLSLSSWCLFWEVFLLLPVPSSPIDSLLESVLRWISSPAAINADYFCDRSSPSLQFSSSASSISLKKPSRSSSTGPKTSFTPKVRDYFLFTSGLCASRALCLSRIVFIVGFWQRSQNAGGRF